VKQRVNIPRPVKGYNNNMGGVDLSDQLLKYYEIIRKSKKWWKTLFFHFFDVAIVNSFIIHKSIGGELNHKTFRVNLAKTLLANSEILPQGLGDHQIIIMYGLNIVQFLLKMIDLIRNLQRPH